MCNWLDLDKFLKAINWSAVKLGDILYYSSNSSWASYNFVVREVYIERKVVIIKAVM